MPQKELGPYHCPLVSIPIARKVEATALEAAPLGVAFSLPFSHVPLVDSFRCLDFVAPQT